MLKATIDADMFREAIDAISALIPECRLHTDETGISTRAVDTANVAMIALTLKKEAFDSFKATNSQLGIDMMKMKNIFGMAGKGDLISHRDGGQCPEDVGLRAWIPLLHHAP